MRPEPNNDFVEIPMTFDVTSGTPPLTEKRLTLGFLISLGIVVASIVLAILSSSWSLAIPILIIGVIAMTIFRVVWFNEIYYRKKMSELVANDYTYSSKVIWDIYEIAPGFPICSFKNGTKAVFVSFDKDIIVGKPDDNEFLHYEAIAEGLQTVAHKGITCMHLDYMDTVGKDGRLDDVIKGLLETPNEELRQLLSLVFEYQQYTMTKSYSTYDVFVFFYKYNDSEFQDDLESIVGSFMNANYVRYRLLGANQIRELVKSIYNLEDFSVNEACDNVFKKEEGSKYIRVIWTECDGKRTVFSKTAEEKAAERAAKQQQMQKKKKPIKPIPKQSTAQEEELIDIFADMGEKPVVDSTASDEFIYLDDADIMRDFTKSTNASNTGTTSETSEAEIDIFADNNDEDIDIFE